MDLSALGDAFQRRFEASSAARESALGAARRAIRSSANAIRAIHRGEPDVAERLMDEARAALDAGRDAVRSEHPQVYFAGFLQDAQKEYAEARITHAIIRGDDGLPSPEELEVEPAAYLNGMAEAIGEGRRAVLDLLRQGRLDEAARILDRLEDLFAILVSIDFPDAITGNLRRSTDVARSLLERTRGDLTVTQVQRALLDALAEHARLLGPPDAST